MQDSYWNKKGIFGYMPMVVLFIVFVGCRRDALDHISFSVYFCKRKVRCACEHTSEYRMGLHTRGGYYAWLGVDSLQSLFFTGYSAELSAVTLTYVSSSNQ